MSTWHGMVKHFSSSPLMACTPLHAPTHALSASLRRASHGPNGTCHMCKHYRPCFAAIMDNAKPMPHPGLEPNDKLDFPRQPGSNLLYKHFCHACQLSPSSPSSSTSSSSSSSSPSTSSYSCMVSPQINQRTAHKERELPPAQSLTLTSSSVSGSALWSLRCMI
jgi:hypothetical protein